MARFTRFLQASSNRRSFLAQVGLWSSTVAGVSVLGREAPAPRESPSPSPLHVEGRIGFLMPSAALCRGLDEHLLTGFQFALDQARAQGGDIRVEVVRATTGLSASAYRKAAENLLKKDRVDLVVALAQPGAVASMASVFEEAQRCLVAVDGGANLVRQEAQGRYVFFNTLGHWESNWAMGRWASNKFKGPGYLVSSGFEAGHDGLRAFKSGVDSVGGSQPNLSFPRTPLREAPSGRSMDYLVSEIQSTAPAFVAAFLNGRDGADFLRAYAHAGLQDRIPLLVSSFLAEEAVAQGYGDSAVGLYSASSWSSGSATPENQAFLAAYKRRFGKEADAFALLGFDTALMLMGAITACGGQARIVREHLETTSWKGPRGPVAMDTQTHTSSGGTQLSVLKRDGGVFRNVLVESLPGIRTGDLEAVRLRAQARGAVLNPYPIY